MRKLFFFIHLVSFSALFSQTFIEVTEKAGLQKSIHSNGIAVADYDGDGDLDIYIIGAKKYDAQDQNTWNRLYKNNGNGTFSDVTEEANVKGIVSSPFEFYEGAQYGAIWGDFDNDNDPDLYLTNIGYNVLYKNNGDGTFSDISETAGVKGALNTYNAGACWWDYDLDGDLDLYVYSYLAENILYENIGQDSFIDATEESGLGDKGKTLSSIPFDANNDLLPDLYVINDYGRNHFYINQGDGSFADSTALSGLEDAGNGMGATIGDYNNDGFFDIYLTNISSVDLCPLFENQGNGFFIDKAEGAGVSYAGWGWGTEFFDYNHDGSLDLYVVNGHIEESGNNYFFYNLLESDLVAPDKRGAYYWDISDSSGVNSSAEARALVTFDYDDDGDLDMLVGNFQINPHLYENVTATKNWLKVKLKGTVSNRDAFGALVSVTCGDKKFYRINDGQDYLGQSIKPLHFGLATAAVIDTLEVTWPNGDKEIFGNIAANQTLTIVEREGISTGLTDENLPENNIGFELLGNYPNPFNNATKIAFKASYESNAHLKIYNVSGQEIYNRRLKTLNGTNHIGWQGIDHNGQTVSSGIYFYTIRLDEGVQLSGNMLQIK